MTKRKTNAELDHDEAVAVAVKRHRAAVAEGRICACEAIHTAACMADGREPYAER